MFRTIIVGLALCLLAPGQNLLQRTRWGNLTNDLAYISDAPYKGQIVILDAYAVYALPENTQSASAVHRLFDTRNIPMASGGIATGITYMPGQKFFFLSDPGIGADGYAVRSMPKVDLLGNYLGALALTYGPGMLQPNWVEGLDTVPADSPDYPGHVLRAVTLETETSVVSWIDVVNPSSGAVVHQIQFTDPSMAECYVAAVAYLGPDRMLVSFWGNMSDKLAVVDFDGDRVGSYIQNSLHGYPEGLQKLPGGLVAGAAPYEGVLWYFDPATLQFLPQNDLKYQFGIGLQAPNRFAWSGDLERYLAYNTPPVPGSTLFNRLVSTIPWTMRSPALLVDLLAVNPNFRAVLGITALHGEGTFAVTHNRVGDPLLVPRSLQLFSNSGTYQGQIDVSGIGRGVPARVRYIPPEQLFAIRFSGKARVLTLVDKTGIYRGEVDFGLRAPNLPSDPGETVSGFAYFQEASGDPGRWLVWALDNLTGTSRVLLAERNGAVIEERPFAEVRKKLQGVMMLSDLDYITSGPHKGAFCARDQEDLFVFRWR